MERHIARKHSYGFPVLTPGYESKSNSQQHNEFPKSNHSDPTAQFGKTKTSTFLHNYQFEDKGLKICYELQEALKLDESPKKTLIMFDLMKKIRDLDKPNFQNEIALWCAAAQSRSLNWSPNPGPGQILGGYSDSVISEIIKASNPSSSDNIGPGELHRKPENSPNSIQQHVHEAFLKVYKVRKREKEWDEIQRMIERSESVGAIG